MNQFALLHFTINKNDRLFQIVLQPGTPWPDLEEVMEEFKVEFEKAKKDQQDLAAKNQEQKPFDDHVSTN